WPSQQPSPIGWPLRCSSRSGTGPVWSKVIHNVENSTNFPPYGDIAGSSSPGRICLLWIRRRGVSNEMWGGARVSRRRRDDRRASSLELTPAGGGLLRAEARPQG